MEGGVGREIKRGRERGGARCKRERERGEGREGWVGREREGGREVERDVRRARGLREGGKRERLNL